jgi:hypothetical protein
MRTTALLGIVVCNLSSFLHPSRPNAAFTRDACTSWPLWTRFLPCCPDAPREARRIAARIILKYVELIIQVQICACQRVEKILTRAYCVAFAGMFRDAERRSLSSRLATRLRARSSLSLEREQNASHGRERCAYKPLPSSPSPPPDSY